MKPTNKNRAMVLALVAGVLIAVLLVMRENHSDAMAASLRKIKSDNVTLAIARINKYYDEQNEAAARAAKYRDAKFDLDVRERESLRKLALANQELSKSVELRDAKTREEREAIEAKYKSAFAAINHKFADTQSEAKRILLLTQADEADAAAQSARDQIAELTPQLEKLHRQVVETQKAAAKLAY